MRLTTRHVILAVIALLVIASIIYSFSKGSSSTDDESHLMSAAPQSNIELVGEAALINDAANREIQLIEPTQESDGFAADPNELENIVDGGMNGQDDVFMVYK